MIRLSIGVLLIIIPVGVLVWYHHALWTSGGPDSNKIILVYMIPYFFTGALSLGGVMVAWKGFKLLRK